MQQRLELCTEAVKLLKHNSSLTPLAAAQKAYDEGSNHSDPDEQQQSVTAFVGAQLSAWMEVLTPCLLLGLVYVQSVLLLPEKLNANPCSDVQEGTETFYSVDVM